MPYQVTLRVATSGFQYDDWQGTVYPPDLPARGKLPFYERELGFKALEVNFTYYALPSLKGMEGMAEATGDDFLFAVKAHRSLTHEREDEPDRETASRLVGALEPLRERGRLATVLAQFPYGFVAARKNAAYLLRLRDALAPLPLTVEFRHRDWQTDEVFDWLSRQEISCCIVDGPQISSLPAFLPRFHGQTAYFRFHGRNTQWFGASRDIRYNYEYSPEELSGFVRPVLEATSEPSRTVLAFFNNHHAGAAVRNALALIRLIEEETGGSNHAEPPAE